MSHPDPPAHSQTGVLYPMSETGLSESDDLVPKRGEPVRKSTLYRTLPDGVEALRQGRIATCQASAVVAALFASVEATLISASNTTVGSPVVYDVELVLAYSVLFASASTTFTSLLLIDRLGGSIPFTTMIGSEVTVTQTARKSGRGILARYGARGRQWDILEFH
ncbi:hypothetical protein FRB98_001321, partial [Tulasnella sp. 332]